MSKTYPQFLLFGDSIIQQSSYLRDGYSFGAILAEHCIRRFDVVNRGLSGYNTANAMVILQDIIPPPNYAKVAFMLILFGANDACLPDSPSSQHVPLEMYRQNIKDILTHPAINAHNPTIFLVTPPPINEMQIWDGDHAKGYPTITRRQSVTAQYADAVRQIATESKNDKLVLIDLHSAMMQKAITLTPGYVEGASLLGTLQGGDSVALKTLFNEKRNPYMLFLAVDGLHLTGAGYKVFIEELLPHIQTPPFIFPVWTDAPRIDRE
ncbi:hypothetical protein EG329_011568 [Mollisiaceae sp. DMI_Dod_QoI]|nr:hypothetical protein EG329_011568 [Helotiales sp. DMI_Dod_QoI]